MRTTAVHGSIAFRRKLIFGLILIILAISTILKYGNILAYFFVNNGAGSVSDVAGLTLVGFITSVAWQEALQVGLIVSVSTFATIVGLILIQKFGFPIFRPTVTSNRALKRETVAYLFICTTTGVIGLAGIEALLTVSQLVFLPLSLYALLNPIWERDYYKSRLIFSIILSFGGFTLVGSKTVIFHLFIAFSLSALYRDRNFVRFALISGVFLIIYPYLNIFRGLLNIADPSTALKFTSERFFQELSADGVIQLATNAYGKILDRMVGLDGVLVAISFKGQEFLTARDIAYELVGFEEIGISLGAFGQIYLELQDLVLAALLYPILVVFGWRLIVIIDNYATNLSFTSLGVFLSLKGSQMMLGGVRLVDLKVTFASIFLIFVIAFGIRFLTQAFPQKRPSIFRASERTDVIPNQR